MSAAVRIVELTRSAAPTSSPEPVPVSTIRPSMRPTLGASMRPTLGLVRRSLSPSMRPTLVPSSRSTVLPRDASTFATEPPSTQRSATVHPRFEAAAHEANNLVAVMRLNVQFLESLVEGSSPLAADALTDIHHTLDRLENRIGSWSQPRSR